MALGSFDYHDRVQAVEIQCICMKTRASWLSCFSNEPTAVAVPDFTALKRWACAIPSPFTVTGRQNFPRKNSKQTIETTLSCDDLPREHRAQTMSMRNTFRFHSHRPPEFPAQKFKANS